MFHYLLRILKILKTPPITTFKVVGVSGKPENKDTKIIYQVSGKATVATEKPATLINELMVIEGFTKEDSRLICNLFWAEKFSASFRILSIQFTDTPARIEIEDLNSKYKLLLTAEEIVSSKQMKGNFSTADLSIIYFQFFKENEEKQKVARQRLLRSDSETNLYYLKNMRPVNEFLL